MKRAHTLNIIKITTYTLILFFILLLGAAEKIKLNPYYSTVFYKRGKDCLNKCSVKEQKHYYQKAVYHDPLLSDAYYRLASIFEREGKTNMALRLYKKVTELDFSNHEAHFKTALNYFQKGEFERAARYFQQAIKHYPNKTHEARCYLGWIYDTRKDYGAATWQYRYCVSSDKEYMDKVNFRAGAGFHKLGQKRLALWYVEMLRNQKRDDLAGQLEQFIETGQEPEYLIRIDLTK